MSRTCGSAELATELYLVTASRSRRRAFGAVIGFDATLLAINQQPGGARRRHRLSVPRRPNCLPTTRTASNDQDIDLVVPDAIRQLIGGPLQDISPSIGDVSEGVRDRILGWSAGITNDFELRLVVGFQHWPEYERGRAIPELGRHIAQNDSPVWIAVVVVLHRVPAGNPRPKPAPPLRSRR